MDDAEEADIVCTQKMIPEVHDSSCCGPNHGNSSVTEKDNVGTPSLLPITSSHLRIPCSVLEDPRHR